MLDCSVLISQTFLQKHLDIIQRLLSLWRAPDWEQDESMGRS